MSCPYCTHTSGPDFDLGAGNKLAALASLTLLLPWPVLGECVAANFACFFLAKRWLISIIEGGLTVM